MSVGPRRATGRLSADRGWLAIAAITLVILAAAVVVVVLGDRLSFFNDDWYFLLQRPGLESHHGLDTLLAPHNSNLVVFPAIIYKLLVALFGLSSQVPFRVVLGMSIAALGVVVYLLVSRRAGTAWGLAAAAVVVFLGPAWEDLLFFASIDLIGSLVAGLAAMLALERDTARRNAAACGLLVIAVGFSNLGIAFVAGAAVCVLLRGRPGQLWIGVVPLALFGAWWVGYGHTQPSHLSTSNTEHLPAFVLHSAEAGVAALTGFSAGEEPATYARGRVLLLVAFVLVIVWAVRGGRPTRSLLVPLATLLVFWILTGASFYPGREPFASRYQLINVTLIILVVACLGRPGPKAAGWALVAVVLAVAVVTANSVDGLTSGYRFLRTQASYVKVDLGILQAMRGHIPPHLWLLQSVADNPYMSGVTGARYVAVTAAHGTPGVYSVSQILRRTPQQRQSADGVLIAVEQLHATVGGHALGDCLTVGNQSGDSSSELSLTPGVTIVKNTTPHGLAIGLRRFAPPGLVNPIALIAAGGTEQLRIPRDALPRTWYLEPYGSRSAPAATLRVCR